LISNNLRIEFSRKFWYDLGHSLKAMMETSKHGATNSEPGIGGSRAEQNAENPSGAST